ALTETQYKWERPVRTEQSICDGCSVGCTMTYEVNQWGKVVRAIPELNSPVNQGQACFKGKFGFDHVNDKRRIKQPMVRRDGELREATWEEALQAAADGLAPHKGGAFALIGSPRNTNEEMYISQKFARAVMRSNHVDVISNDKPGMAEGLQKVLGYFAGTASFADVAGASLTMVVSANITEEQNVAAVPIKRAVRAGRQKLIVIDHREVELTRYADLWLRPYPGTDPVLLGGILRAVIDAKLVDQQAVAEQCEGFDDLVASLTPFTPEAVSRQTGVSTDKIQAAAELYAGSGPAVTLFAVDGSVHATRTTISQAVADLALVTGNIGRPNAGVIPLFHGANDQGAWDMGMWPSALPGHVFTDDPEAVERFSKGWSTELVPYRGTGNRSMFTRMKAGDIKAMLVMGDHVHYEDGSQGDVDGAFEALEFLVVTDAFLSKAAEKADVVFPAAQWAEKTGTFTNIERRVQPLRPVVCNTTVDSRDDLDIVCAIATLMGAAGFLYDGPEQVLDEIASLVPEYAGISYQRLMDDYVTTAKPSNENPQPTQVMYSDDVRQGIRWPAASPGRYGKAKLGQLVWHAREANEDKEFPLVLAHGRVLAQPARPMKVTLADKLNVIDRAEELVLNPADAERLNLKELSRVTAVTALGDRHPGVVRVSDDVLPGMVSLTTLFGELAADIDRSDRPDRMNHVPRLYPVPVKIEPA
ncbi:MAG: molybdopterin-dependent oxidoreductase, partial [Dehalococcoidia bacterium]